jgi:hypothetical protein
VSALLLLANRAPGSARRTPHVALLGTCAASHLWLQVMCQPQAPGLLTFWTHDCRRRLHRATPFNATAAAALLRMCASALPYMVQAVVHMHRNRIAHGSIRLSSECLEFAAADRPCCMPEDSTAPAFWLG